MRLQCWLRRSLWGAFALSLFLHILSVFGEEIYDWLSRPEFEQTKLKKPTRELKSLSLDEPTNAELAGISKPEFMRVYLRKRSVAKAVERPAAKRTLRPPAPAIKPIVPVIASSVVPETFPPVAEVSIASAVAASVASATAAEVAASHPAGKVDTETQVASAPVSVAPEPDLKLDHYPREMKITYIYGVIPMRMTWKVSGGRYDLRLDGGFLWKSRTFVSSGKVDKRGVTPDIFLEYRDGKPEPFYQVDFDWQNLFAEVGEPGKRKIEPTMAGDQDIFSAAFHVGLIGGSKPEYTFSIFSGRRKYEDVRMRVAGEARLRLGQHDVDALLLRGVWDDRQVDFWLAPEWHNIPVRITIGLGKELSLDIWANEVTIEGKKVLEWVKPGK